jgi:hypothetical protein
VPLLDGSDRVGVLAFTADSPDEDDRRVVDPSKKPAAGSPMP